MSGIKTKVAWLGGFLVVVTLGALILSLFFNSSSNVKSFGSRDHKKDN